MKKTSKLGSIGLALAFGIAFWRWLLPDAPATHTIGVLDVSLSGPRDCRAFSLALLSGARAGQHSSRSTVTAFATGDSTTAFEPSRLMLPAIPEMRKATEPPHLGDERMNGYLAAAHKICEELASTDTSPVYLALLRAVELARSLDGRANVVAFTDLQETAWPAIKKALGDSLGAAIPTISPKIDNTGVDVQICGYASTRGSFVDGAGKPRSLTHPRTETRVGRLLEVWRSFFTAPERVFLAPVCIF